MHTNISNKITCIYRGGGGEEGVQSQILKKK